MQLIEINGEKFYKIENHNHMRPFFMSIVSDSNHWMFISSNGGLSAGRKNAEFALFPYYTDDKITEMYDVTGSKTIVRIHLNDEIKMWEPFSDRFNENYKLKRNLYKSIYGNSIIFEEILEDYQLSFRYKWSSSHIYGFVRSSQIENFSNNNFRLTILDGLQNIMPHGVHSDLQNSTSNLVDAYKRNELHPESGLGIFALSAIIVDKAEPSEALKCNTVWSLGLDKPSYLLSSRQLNAFRYGGQLSNESDVKGERGAYFIIKDFSIQSKTSNQWHFIANVNQNQSQIIALSEAIVKDENLIKKVLDDVKQGTKNLISLNANADGLQYTADDRKDNRHFANVLFNIMRGGIFGHNYQIEKHDFVNYFKKANQQLFSKSESFLNQLTDFFKYQDLLNLSHKTSDNDIIRLSTEYLPLRFSRRHGDPSRPWNKFSINTQNEIDGSKILDFQGNWRDIFQNWEALAYAYPQFIEGMIFKFLNATTFDGYNPYRVTKDGFDWEVIEPDDPWSYIGYWGDHQIIYLLKFLEFIEKTNPNKLHDFFDKDYFVYAAVPYTIKSYQDILKNAKDTIDYDHQWDEKINKRRENLGADGALIFDNSGEVYRVNFIEKILATLLAKMSNFIPEGGIWMNTQRPEWNDANNALVGNGVSMVTLYYLRRFLKYFQGILEKYPQETIKISSEMVEFYHAIREGLLANKNLLNDKISDKDRKKILDILGTAASEYRLHIYNNGFWGKKRTHSKQGLINFTQICLAFIEHSIKYNQREDYLFHAYNLMSVNDNEVKIDYLSEMLEGQVAVLSAGYLKPNESLNVLNALKNSYLYRADQQSYILYPNKELPKFLEKNTIKETEVSAFALIKKLEVDNKLTIMNKDLLGQYHFDGNFNNANSLKQALAELKLNNDYKSLVEAEEDALLNLFEKTFKHKAFTGRSGTFFAFEGLGSIYWHMVSKLHLAVYEVIQDAYNQNTDQNMIDALTTHFREIGEGIGVHKTAQAYGAFPTDPYSHTPAHKGAQQPGMTGQVKEDVLTRIGELGLFINDGQIHLNPFLLNQNEFLKTAENVCFISIDGIEKSIQLNENSLAFSFCQVPIIYQLANESKIIIHYNDETIETINKLSLSKEISAEIFKRTGKISKLNVQFKKQ
jgi:hypothetical protein